jgi:beta-aspartyl-peptidase (threonine type)
MAERWSIIVHGGARSIPAEQQARNRVGCRDAIAIGVDILRSGGAALEAALQAVKALEDDTTFNAGSGAVSNAEGDYELDAAIMEGTALNIGAVAALRNIRNPVVVARLLLDEPSVLLVADGAQAFAVRKGVAINTADPRNLAKVSPGEQHDTVGCVALDKHGRMAVATSTGGLTGQSAGRVGDAPLAGCGFYVDDAIGGVAISGDGEGIIRLALAGQVMRALENAGPTRASRTALASLDRVGGEAGIIALGKDGRFGVSHNSAQFAVAMADERMPEPRAGVHLSEYEDLLDDG